MLGEDFHHVTAMQHRLDGSELAVDTCIMGMLSDMTVNLKSEIERRGLLWKIDGLSFGSEDHNIIIIERSDYILNETTFLLVELHILQNVAETVYPPANIALLTLCNDSYGIVAHHALGCDMDLLPTAIV